MQGKLLGCWPGNAPVDHQRDSNALWIGQVWSRGEGGDDHKRESPVATDSTGHHPEACRLRYGKNHQGQPVEPRSDEIQAVAHSGATTPG